MNHDLVRALAQYLVYLLLILVPALLVLFSDRFRRRPEFGEWAILLALGGVIGILLYLPAITIIAGMALLVLGLARLTARYAFAGLTMERTVEPARLFPGDTATLTIRLDNRKLLPLASLHVFDPIQHGLMRPGSDLDDMLHFSGGVDLLDDLGHALVMRTAVSPFQRVTRSYTVEARRRGVYTLGPARAVAGDPFGLFERTATLTEPVEMIVYPRIYQPNELGLPFREALGEVTARDALVEDPILLAGSREYRPGDPLHRMHWKATARTGELQVRLSDPSTTAQLLFVVNLNTYQHLWQGVDLERMEATIDVAASVGLWALDRGFAVGLRSNGIVPGMENTPRLQPAAHPRQSIALLEHLARLSFSGRYAPEDVLVEEAQRLPAGAAIVFVTPILTPTLTALLSSRRLKRRVSVVYCGRFAAPVVPGVPIYLVTPPREHIRAVS